MTRATYNADNTLTELPGMNKPKKPRRKDYDLTGAMISAAMLQYEFDLAVYKGHVSQLRTIPCSPECRGLFEVGKTYEEGKDYEVRNIGCINMAFPLPVKSEDDLWAEALSFLVNNPALNYPSQIKELKSRFIITKR